MGRVGQYMGLGMCHFVSSTNHKCWSNSADEKAEVLLNLPWPQKTLQFITTSLFSINNKNPNNSHSYSMCTFLSALSVVALCILELCC